MNLDAGTTPAWVVAADLNSDNISDFAVSDGLGASVAVALSNGNGSFHAQPSLFHGMPTWAAVAGDFNGDGFWDLAVTNNIVPGAIEVLLSRGDGTFAPPISTFLPECFGSCGPVALAVADFDRDGNLDCAVVEANVGIIIFLGNGNGTLRFRDTIVIGQLGSNTASIAISDFNNDGIPDYALSVQGADSVLVGLGNGNGSFEAAQSFPVEHRPEAIAVADFNRDGFQDVVVTNLFSHSFSVLLGRGDGTFERALNQDTVQGSRSVAVGDFNSDGIPDVVVTNDQGGGNRHNSVLLFKGIGDGKFEPPVRFPGGIYNPFQLVVADIDGDGKPDVVIGNATANSLSVLLGDGAGQFEPAASFVTGNNPNSIAIGDFNNDGKPDLATANLPTDLGFYSISVLLNDTR